MTTQAVADQHRPAVAVTTPPTRKTDPQRPSTLVWIDAREAVFIHWLDGETSVERIRSHVPARHRGTGHIRHDACSGHGGGGPQATTGEQRRLELLGRFVAQVADRLPVEDALLILGPGTVRQRLEHAVATADRHHRRARSITCRAAPRMSEARLVEQLHDFVGLPAPRQTHGTPRGNQASTRRAAGQTAAVQRRVVVKPAPEAGEWDT
jgi:hypothetical protein